MRIRFNNVDDVVKFVKICEGFSENIDVRSGRYMVDGKSVLGVTAICSMENIDADIVSNDDSRWIEFRNAIKDFLYT